MISIISPLPVGNAIKIILDPPDNAAGFALLRNLTGVFVSPDQLAVGDIIIDSGSTKTGFSESVLDTSEIENGTEYFYCPFYLVNSDWVAGDTRSATPSATYIDRSVDAMTIVLDRVAAGLKVEIERGNIRHESEEFPVLSAPPQFDDTQWPVVSVHMDMEAPQVRSIGETLFPDESEDQQFDESEGYYAKSSINVIGWSLNPDERIEIRKALRRIFIANLPVFEGLKMHEVSITQTDMEDFERYSAPVYMTSCVISSLVPAHVSGKVEKVANVKLTSIVLER